MHQNFIYHAVAHGTLSSDPDFSDEGVYWRSELASDLRYPQYKMSMPYALGRRIAANYIYLFTILMAGWLMKIKLHPNVVTDWPNYLEQAAVGRFSGWFTFSFIIIFMAHLIVLLIGSKKKRGGRDVLQNFREPEQE